MRMGSGSSVHKENPLIRISSKLENGTRNCSNARRKDRYVDATSLTFTECTFFSGCQNKLLLLFCCITFFLFFTEQDGQCMFVKREGEREREVQCLGY